jgi:hypothetical protein
MKYYKIKELIWYKSKYQRMILKKKKIKFDTIKRIRTKRNKINK